MKKINVFLPVIPAFILFFCTDAPAVQNKTSGTNVNTVVLELFTSQGCSSCPPADRLLGSYANKKNIIPLSFHVDYWNHLGWKDPFSDHVFSERQETYASAFALGGLYTPQLVINGQKEMVGSDDDKIAGVIRQFQGEQSSSYVKIGSIKTESNKATVLYSLHGKFNNSVINIALVQNKVTTPVKAGENDGVTLTNYNVVRTFKTISSFNKDVNTANIDMPSLDKKEFSIIVFIQDKTSYKIYSAARSSL